MFGLFKKKLKAEDIGFDVVMLINDQSPHVVTAVIRLMGINDKTNYQQDTALVDKASLVVSLSIALLQRELLGIQPRKHHIFDSNLIEIYSDFLDRIEVKSNTKLDLNMKHLSEQINDVIRKTMLTSNAKLSLPSTLTVTRGDICGELLNLIMLNLGIEDVDTIFEQEEFRRERENYLIGFERCIRYLNESFDDYKIL